MIDKVTNTTIKTICTLHSGQCTDKGSDSLVASIPLPNGWEIKWQKKEESEKEF